MKPKHRAPGIAEQMLETPLKMLITVCLNNSNTTTVETMLALTQKVRFTIFLVFLLKELAVQIYTANQYQAK